MVGLNHEFGRELLWREYPTDERGSYFRQFWSVQRPGRAAGRPAVTAEQLKAMLPRHRAARHLDHRVGRSAPTSRRSAPKTGDLVLTIRGELLKKYPNTLIYAQKAHMARQQIGTRSTRP